MRGSNLLRSQLATVLAVILSIALFLLLQRTVTNLYWNARVTSPSFDRMKQVKEAAKYVKDRNLIVLGDSTAVASIDPAVLKDEFGRTSENLGTFAHIAPVADPFLLRLYLQYHPRPEDIVVIRSPTNWWRKIEYPLVRENYASVPSALQLLKAHEPLEHVLSLLTASIIPSLNYRYTLQRVGVSLSSVRKNLLFEPIVPVDEDTAGFTVRTGTLSEEALRDFVKNVHDGLNDPESNFYQPTEENLQLAGYLCALAAKNNVPLLFALGPYPDVFASDRAFQRLQSDIVTKLTAAIGENPNCHVREGLPLPRRQMNDLWHPNSTGAAVFTKAVGETLR